MSSTKPVDSSSSPAGQAVQRATPGTSAPSVRAWATLGMLCFVYVLNFLSRQLPAILAKPIQDSLHVSDSKLGLIGGLYFALFYCCISIPVGWAADRTNRSRVLAAACAIWSTATMCCGMAPNYWLFAVAFMTVGFGEAGGVPPSYSIICDYFPPGRRGTALGLFNVGPALGATMAIAFGASIASAFSWRIAFVSLGAVGVITAFGIIFAVREPERGGLDRASGNASTGRAGFGQTFAMFFSRPSLLFAGLASGATQMVTYGLSNFVVLFLMREKGMTLRQVAVYYAIVIFFGMGGGMLVSGRVIDRFTKVSKQAYALIPAITLAIGFPLYLCFVGAASWKIALLFLVGTIFFNFFFLSSAVTMVQEEVRPDQRVMSGALVLLVMNLIGLGFGPTYVGAASDLFRAAHPNNSLQMAFYALAPFYLVAIGLFLNLARILRNETRAVIALSDHTIVDVR